MTDLATIDPPRLTYVARSFLDYRVPVFAHLCELLEGQLSVVYSKIWTPPRVQERLNEAIGARAIGLEGEKRLGNDGRAGFANSSFCIPYQPGLFRAIRATNPDVLAGDGFFRWTPAAMAYRTRYRKPLVMCYERTMHTERNAQRVRTMYRRLAAKMFDAVSCSGQLSVDYMRWLGYPQDRINIGHQAADTEQLRERVAALSPDVVSALRTELNAPGLVFLCVARLIPLKGVQELLTAWKRFRSSNATDASLVLVGDGPERGKLEEYAKQEKLPGVRFIGSVDYQEIAPYFAMADALVMPTLEDNWSLVVPEAMACGLPVVSSKYNGCWPELVQPRENGWVYDPLDANEAVAALAAVANTSDLAKYGRRSREIINQHTPRHAAQAIFDACQIALRRGKRVAASPSAAL